MWRIVPKRALSGAIGWGGSRGIPGRLRTAVLSRFATMYGIDVNEAEKPLTEYAGFDDFWQPFTLAVGPAGQYLHHLSAGQQAAVRDACRAQLPDGPFTLPARAWYARGLVPPRRDA